MGENLEEVAFWHQRFSQQARWTYELRRFLFNQIELRNNIRILEVGCGTGALLGEDIFNPLRTHGLDINADYLRWAKNHLPHLYLVQGDAHLLPYSNASFDLAFCHFLLLWVQTPARVIQEMRRVTRPGGSVMAFAEPDYGGRIDYPPQLAPLGHLQTQALALQGAQPMIGRQLAELFHQAGLQDIQWGILGGQWRGSPSPEEWELEWAVLQIDLNSLIPPSELLNLKNQDAQAWKNGQRVLFVPMFYAWGRVRE